MGTGRTLIPPGKDMRRQIRTVHRKVGERRCTFSRPRLSVTRVPKNLAAEISVSATSTVDI